VKTPKLPSLLVIAACQVIAGTCLALTPVSEDFQTASLVKQRWQFFNSKNALLKHAGTRLSFAVPENFSREDYSYAELRNNQPGYNENWQVVLDVKNSAFQGDEVGVGFWIYNADDPGDVAFLEFYGNRGRKNQEYVCACFVTDGQHLTKDFTLKAKRLITAGKLKISFNKTTKILTFSFRAEGARNSWREFGTFSVNGVGGSQRANWNMNPASGRFGIRLEAYGERSIVMAGAVSMDNFVLQAPK
jgi:hypothetical protein